MKKDRTIQVRVSDQDYRILEVKSKERGINKSAYIRELILHDCMHSKLHGEGFRLALDDINSAYFELYGIAESDETIPIFIKMERGLRDLWRFLQ